MSDHITSYPLTWPAGWKRTKVQEHARFSKKTGQYSRRDVSISDAVSFVIEELGRMDVGDWNVIISTNLKLRLDGLPYSNQKDPDDNGVSVWWKDGSKQLVIAIDKYTRAADNLYAIGKTIEAMRGIDRWGSGEILERTFTGFEALPDLREDHWWAVLGVSSLTPADEVIAAYKKARIAAHPDKPTGSQDKFNSVVNAYETFKNERGFS